MLTKSTLVIRFSVECTRAMMRPEGTSMVTSVLVRVAVVRGQHATFGNGVAQQRNRWPGDDAEGFTGGVVLSHGYAHEVS
jgi:hypothetical protein